MLRSRSLRASAVAVSFIIAACGSDTSKRKTAPSDAGPDAAGGSGGRTSGTGGRTSGTGGGLGSGGTGGTKDLDGAVESGATGGRAAVADASADSSVPSADAGNDAGPLQCAGPTTDSEGQWLDVAANVCRQCPATAPACDDFLAGGAAYDPVSQIITFHFTPGINQVLNGTFHTAYTYTNASNISIFGSLDNLPAVVSGNTVTVNLTGLLPPNTTNLYGGVLSTTDACGAPVTTDSDCLVFSMSQYSTVDGLWTVDCSSNCT